jgi:FtsP/CotA-like multicopper oxidase with cupredoxin domain
VLKAGAGIVAMPLLASWHRRPARASELSARLVPAPAIVNIVGEKYPSTPVWAYNATVPGPLLRVRRGARLRVTLENGIPDATTIHWHGIRVPNAMDGVPHLTQPPVERAQSFVYEFAAEDAGTYWYHPHWQSHEQVERGLYGALIVDEDEPPRVDRDVLWVLDDWKLSGDAKLVEDFGNFFDVSHAGRLGNTVTVGGKVVDQFRVRSGERLRLRLVNTANARIFALGFGALKPRVIATDGHGIAPHEPERGLVVLGPGMRADLIVDCLGRSGDSVTVTDEFRPQQAYRLVEIVYGDEPPLRDHAPDGPVALAPNLVPSPKLDEAARHQLVFAGGMMGSLREAEMDGRRRPMREIMQHRMAWAVNGKVATGHSHEPILRLQRGRSYRLSLTNDTAWHHPIHLHGHTFKVLSRNGVPLAHDEWRDTVLMNPRDDLEIAFVADNPGDWMLHCHILEHQAGGMMAVVRVS